MAIASVYILFGLLAMFKNWLGKHYHFLGLETLIKGNKQTNYIIHNPNYLQEGNKIFIDSLQPRLLYVCEFCDCFMIHVTTQYSSTLAIYITMFSKNYKNFVRPSSSITSTSINKDCTTLLSGKEAKRLYLEEVKDAKVHYKDRRIQKKVRHTPKTEHVNNKDLFLTVQNNDVDKLKQVLDNHPDKINLVDDYGWSLLMIACQGNCIETAKELLKRNIDISTRDKAGNSAQSLVIKNKNHILANLLLNSKWKHKKNIENQSKVEVQEFTCEICNKTFPDKSVHLSSTIHNINASKGRKATASYGIPASNKGYQIMLKVGWDKDTGLGPNGSGKLYPIRTVQKKDRKGLGNEKKKNEDSKEDTARHNNKRKSVNDYQNSRQMEIHFRREFY